MKNKNVNPRNFIAYLANRRNSAGAMHHKCEPRGGSVNEQRDLLAASLEAMAAGLPVVATDVPGVPIRA